LKNGNFSVPGLSKSPAPPAYSAQFGAEDPPASFRRDCLSIEVPAWH
jgi:hypothetical protein